MSAKLWRSPRTSIVPLRSHPQPRGEPIAIFTVEPRLSLIVPLVGSVAECGFPSPADDYLDRPLDFNELLIENAPTTFVVRVAGDSMTGIGLSPETSPLSTGPGARSTSLSCSRWSMANLP